MIAIMSLYVSQQQYKIHKSSAKHQNSSSSMFTHNMFNFSANNNTKLKTATRTRTYQQLSKMYPRSSPYIQSNLHKYGTGPSSTILPVQNQLPVCQKKLNLSAQTYFKKTQDRNGNVCYCCLEPLVQQKNDSDMVDAGCQNLVDVSSSIEQQKSVSKHSFQQQVKQQQSNKILAQSQTSLMKYIYRNKQIPQNKQQNTIQEQDANKCEKFIRCSDCNKIICQQCTRICARCNRIVCKFDFKDDNSLGTHNCF